MVKNPPANTGDIRVSGSISESGKIPWRRAWQPTPVFLPGESHGQRSLKGYSPQGHEESDTTEQPSMYINIKMESDELVLYLEIVDDILLSGDASKAF